METVIEFILLGSKITADGDCSHEIKTLAPWKKSYNKPKQNQCIQKQRHHFTNKGPYIQSYGFSSSQVVTNKCENWTIRKAEHQRIDAFELWYWKRYLRVHWTTRRSNQSILKEISPEYSLEGLMLNFAQVLGVGEGQGSLVCCSPWGCKESDRAEQLKNNKISFIRAPFS